ncbi:MAG: SMI1/KNR4 family protein [Candidatus Sulfotelmatobacter sp.]
MIDQLQKDNARRPDLFHFFGPILPEQLDAWLRGRKFVVPPDLREFWCQTGGGDLFESETVLSPLGPADTGDDVDSVNQYRWKNGMPPDWLIFHTGIGLTVVKMSSGEYANVREVSYEVQQTFTSLADWYVSFVRREYASRYGLS